MHVTAFKDNTKQRLTLGPIGGQDNQSTCFSHFNSTLLYQSISVHLRTVLALP